MYHSNIDRCARTCSFVMVFMFGVGFFGVGFLGFVLGVFVLFLEEEAAWKRCRFLPPCRLLV